MEKQRGEIYRKLEMIAVGTEGYMLREVHSRNVDVILVMYEARMEFLFVETFELEPVQYHVIMYIVFS